MKTHIKLTYCGVYDLTLVHIVGKPVTGNPDKQCTTRSNSVPSDQMPHVASDLVVQCFHLENYLINSIK